MSNWILLLHFIFVWIDCDRFFSVVHLVAGASHIIHYADVWCLSEPCQSHRLSLQQLNQDNLYDFDSIWCNARKPVFYFHDYGHNDYNLIQVLDCLGLIFHKRDHHLFGNLNIKMWKTQKEKKKREQIEK